MAASTFDGATMHIELDLPTASSPTWERQSYLAVRHIPGSDDDVIQTLGLGGETVAYQMHLSDSEWSALYAKQLTVGTLVVAGTSMGSALLEALEAPIQHIDGWVTVQVRFRRVGA